MKVGIKHTFTRPYTLMTNGKAERKIQTLLRPRLDKNNALRRNS